MSLSVSLSMAQELSTAVDYKENSSVEAYLIALDEAEANYGAYDESIADIYIGLGNAFVQNQNFDKAKDSFLRGMQIERVNNGLYDLGQVPYLQRLTDVAKDQKDWQAASNYLQQAFAIQSQNYEKGNSELSWALLSIVDTHLSAYSEIKNLEDSYRHLEKAYSIGIDEFEQNMPDPAESLEDYLAIRERSIVINYEMAVISVKNVDRRPTFMAMNRRIDDSPVKNLAVYYLDGRKDLMRVIEALEAYGNDPARVASAYTDLADWYLLFNKTNSALTQYRLAYQTALNLESGEELIESMFSDPVILPRYNLPGIPNDKSKSHNLSYSVTVSRFGKAVAIKLLEDPESVSVATKRRGRAYLKSARFRPMLVDEKAVRKENHRVSIYIK